MLDTAEITEWPGSSQFTIPGASAACTSIAMICARMGLNDPHLQSEFDFPKVIRTGALAFAPSARRQLGGCAATQGAATKRDGPSPATACGDCYRSRARSLTGPKTDNAQSAY